MHFYIIQGSNLQPTYVFWLGIEPTVFLVYGMMLQPAEPPGQSLCMLKLNMIANIKDVSVLDKHMVYKTKTLKFMKMLHFYKMVSFKFNIVQMYF